MNGNIVQTAEAPASTQRLSTLEQLRRTEEPRDGEAYDYIIVGSGAGGGPLAANLARAGHKVLLLEAGGDPCADSDLGRYLYEVPIFHGLSTEYKECAWDYWVRHYADDAQQRKDTKYRDVLPETGEKVDGVWYPRAGALGGCTSHNAMITVTPQNIDWDQIAEITGDPSWRAEQMHRYYARLENATYVPRPGSAKQILKGIGWSILALVKGRSDWRDWSHGHGFKGWLTTSEADPKLVLKDSTLVRLLLSTIKSALKGHIGNPLARLLNRFDPNDLRNSVDGPEGVAFTPLAVANGKRNGPREFLLRTRQEHPDNLKIQLRAMVTRILFDGTRAVGVEYREGRHLYAADPQHQTGLPYEVRQVHARREVILATGAFNSPQILMLSGVGPRAELEKFDIPVVADLPGVGQNLQDRYEVGVVTEFPSAFELLKGATFRPPGEDGVEDPFFTTWRQGKGVYSSNGALIGIIKRSVPERKEPDLYIFGLPGFFRGYEPGYSKEFVKFGDRFTWAILKAYTNNTAGRVTLQSADPTQRPRIDFHYFAEGNDPGQDDLDSVVAGVEYVRSMNKCLGESAVKELVPGPEYDTREKLREFIRNEAWGHHASCTNKIGADDDPMAVLDSRFRVRGTQGLRVVDASVFPKIPGYFIVTPIYMISEKAFDVITEDAKRPVTAGVKVAQGGQKAQLALQI